jgi:hypothetical protein
MQIFLADLMVSSDDTALQDRPEALNRVRVDCANDVLANGVVNGLVRETALQAATSGVSIGAKKANPVRHGFADESFKRLSICVLDNASNDITLAFDCADNCGLAGISSASLAAFLVPMSVLIAAADVGFVNLDNPAKLLDVLDHGSADLVAHEPCRLVRAEAHIAEDLEGAHTLLADQHKVRDSVPILQRLIRVLKDCAGQVREAIARLGGALIALPMPRVALQLGRLRRPTTRANDALWPSAHDQIRNTIILCLKHRVELRGGQLMNGFWVRGATHNEFLPMSERNIAWA